jgi:hypothetical protein
MMTEVSDILQRALDNGIAGDMVLSTLRRTITSLLAEEAGRHPIVFFSYSYNDKPIVLEVAEQFRLAGIEVWLDLSEIHFGDNIRERIDRGLDSADFIAFFVSYSSLEKPWTRRELNAIISRQLSGDRGAKVLPILLEDVDIPPVLRDIRFMDLRDHDVKSKAQEMIDAIRYYYRPFKRENNAS